MSKFCKHCGQPYPINSASEAEKLLEQLSNFCKESGIIVDWSGSISEENAAELLNRDVRTIQNWRYGHQPIRFQKLRGRVRYKLTDLAEFIIAEAKK